MIIFDDGPWIYDAKTRCFLSDDFTHDVTLKLFGDFADDEQRTAYADGLLEKLNAKVVDI